MEEYIIKYKLSKNSNADFEYLRMFKHIKSAIKEIAESESVDVLVNFSQYFDNGETRDKVLGVSLLYINNIEDFNYIYNRIHNYINNIDWKELGYCLGRDSRVDIIYNLLELNYGRYGDKLKLLTSDIIIGAAYSNNYNLIQDIINVRILSRNEIDDSINEALVITSAYGNLQTIDYLLGMGGNAVNVIGGIIMDRNTKRANETLLYIIGKGYNSADFLHNAIVQNIKDISVGMVKYFIDMGVNDLDYILEEAASNRRIDIVRLLK